MGQSVHRGIASGKLKSVVFVLEGLNSFSTTYFFYDIYFYTQARFKFGALQNLMLAAVLGVIYAVSAFWGGRFAQRFGYFSAIKWGTGLMAAIFLLGSQCDGLLATLAVICASNAALCLTWPALESLMSEGESRAQLQGWVGVYNVVWAVTGAVAYFTGGAIQQQFGPRSIFFVPAALLLAEAGLAVWLERQAEKQPILAAPPSLPLPVPEGKFLSASPAMFLKMGWLANPVAYVAINTVVSTIPTLSRHFHFSLARAGCVCSIWLFSRAVAFVLLRMWPRWHYRFRYLAWAYGAMILSFGAMLLGSIIWVFVASQIVFGAAIGLIYYSSLFYSMDVGTETKGEHSGIHEAVIGVGNAGGPAVAAAALAFFPDVPGSGAAAVCVLMVAGLGGLFWMRFRERPKNGQTICGGT